LFFKLRNKCGEPFGDGFFESSVLGAKASSDCQQPRGFVFWQQANGHGCVSRTQAPKLNHRWLMLQVMNYQGRHVDPQPT